MTYWTNVVLLLLPHNLSGRRAEVIPLAGAATTDLGVTISASPSATKGQNVTLTISVTNSGGAASAIEVPVILPSGMTYVSDDGNGAFNSATSIWTIASLPSGSSALHIVTMLNSNEPQTIIAEIGASTPLDSNAANNT